MEPSQRELAQFAVEYPNRQRIFTDSIRIVETTTNVDVFKSRISSIRDFLNWMQEQIDNGYPIITKFPPSKAHAAVDAFCNSNAVRIAKAISENVKTSRKALSVFDKVEALSFMLCDAPNKAEAEEEIKEVNMRLVEFI